MVGALSALDALTVAAAISVAVAATAAVEEEGEGATGSRRLA